MSSKRQIEGTLKVKDLKLYITDKEIGGDVEIMFDEKPLFNNYLNKYNGLKVKATIHNPNDDRHEIIGFNLYATIDEIL